MEKGSGQEMAHMGRDSVQLCVPNAPSSSSLGSGGAATGGADGSSSILQPSGWVSSSTPGHASPSGPNVRACVPPNAGLHAGFHPEGPQMGWAKPRAYSGAPPHRGRSPIPSAPATGKQKGRPSRWKRAICNGRRLLCRASPRAPLAGGHGAEPKRAGVP